MPADSPDGHPQPLDRPYLTALAHLIEDGRHDYVPAATLEAALRADERGTDGVGRAAVRAALVGHVCPETVSVSGLMQALDFEVFAALGDYLAGDPAEPERARTLAREAGRVSGAATDGELVVGWRNGEPSGHAAGEAVGYAVVTAEGEALFAAAAAAAGVPVERLVRQPQHGPPEAPAPPPPGPHVTPGAPPPAPIARPSPSPGARGA